MKTLFTYVMLGCIFYSLYWFIQFQKDPYHFCKDHPDPQLTEKYYQCEPFGFELKKGIVDKHLDTPWFDKESDRERKRSQYNRDRGGDADFQGDHLKRIDDKDMKNEDDQ